MPLKYRTLVQTGNSVKISTKHTRSPRAANYIGTTLKTAVKHGRISWNVQVLVNWFLTVPLKYIQKLSFLTLHQLLLFILCIHDIMAATQTWVKNYIALFHSRKQDFKLCQKYTK